MNPTDGSPSRCRRRPFLQCRSPRVDRPPALLRRASVATTSAASQTHPMMVISAIYRFRSYPRIIALGTLQRTMVADPCGPYTLAMAATDHTIRLASGTYARLQAEAARSHRAIDEIAGELLDERLAQPLADQQSMHSARRPSRATIADVLAFDAGRFGRAHRLCARAAANPTRQPSIKNFLVPLVLTSAPVEKHVSSRGDSFRRHINKLSVSSSSASL